MSDTIRDVVIRVAVKMGAIELTPPDVSKWGKDLTEQIRRAAPASGSGKKSSDMIAEEKAMQQQLAGIAKAYSQEYIQAKKQTEAELAGISKAYGQDETKRLKQEAIERAGVAKAYEQDFLKSRREQEAEAAGIAKAYAAEHVANLKAGEDAQRRQIEAAGQMRLSFGQASDGLFQMARGWALNRAAMDGNMEGAVRGFAKFQSVIDQTRGAMAIVRGLSDAYSSVKVSIDASAAAAKVQQSVAAASSGANAANSAAIAGTTTRLGMLTGAMNPYTVLAALAVGSTIAWSEHLNAVQRSLDGVKIEMTEVNQLEREHQRLQAQRVKMRGTSGAGAATADTLGTLGTGLDAVDDILYFMSGGAPGSNKRKDTFGLSPSNNSTKIREWAMKRLGFASEEQQAENRKIIGADEAMRSTRISGERRMIETDFRLRTSERGAAGQNILTGDASSIRLMDLQIDKLRQIGEMKTRALREGLSPEGESNRLASFGARTEAERSRLESANRTAMNRRELEEVDKQIGTKQKQLSTGPMGGGGYFGINEEAVKRRHDAEQDLAALQERRVGILRREGEQLRDNLKTIREQLAANDDARRSEERRLKGMDQRLGEMTAVDQSEFAMLSKQAKEQGGLQQFSLQQLERFGTLGGEGVAPAITQEHARRGAQFRREQGFDPFESVAGPREGEGSRLAEIDKNARNIQFGADGRDLLAEERKNVADANEKLTKGVADLNETLKMLLGSIGAVADLAAKAKEQAERNRKDIDTKNIHDH